MLTKIDYEAFDREGIEYNELNRLSVWVHPLWTRKDLGKHLTDFWASHLGKISQDPNYCLILVQPDMGKTISDEEIEWRRRIKDITDKLSEMFEGRFLNFDKRTFIDPKKEEDLTLVTTTFNLKPILFQKKVISPTSFFLTQELGGLYTDSCVAHQLGLLIGMSLESADYWYPE